FRSGLQKEQRVELSGVPRHGVSRDDAKEEREHHLPSRISECVVNRRGGRLAACLEVREHRRFFQFAPYVIRYRDKYRRHEKRNTPSPGCERGLAGQSPRDKDDEQRHEQSDGGRGINEARVVASLSL